MSKTPRPVVREAASAGAILYIRSMEDRVAPDELGGWTAAEQVRIVQGRIHEDGLTLDRMFWVVCATAGTSEQRLDFMLRVLDEQPVRHLYVLGDAYAHDSEDEIMKHHAVLLMHGVRLTICEDE